MKKTPPSPKRRPNLIDPLAVKEAELKKAEKKIKQLEKSLENRTEELDLLKNESR